MKQWEIKKGWDKLYDYRERHKILTVLKRCGSLFIMFNKTKNKNKSDFMKKEYAAIMFVLSQIDVVQEVKHN